MRTEETKRGLAWWSNWIWEETQEQKSGVAQRWGQVRGNNFWNERCLCNKQNPFCQKSWIRQCVTCSLFLSHVEAQNKQGGGNSGGGGQRWIGGTRSRRATTSLEVQRTAQQKTESCFVQRVHTRKPLHDFYYPVRLSRKGYEETTIVVIF